MSPDTPLETWPAVVAWLEGRYLLARNEPTWVGLFVTERQAWVKVVLERDTVAVLSPACEASRLAVDDPARLVGQKLVMATLVVDRGLYVVREEEALEEITEALLERMIDFVAAQGAAIARAIVRVGGTLDCSNNYAE